MIKVEKNNRTITRIDMTAVQKYHDYFSQLMDNYTFQIRLLNDQDYFVFSSIPKTEWEEIVYDNRRFIAATRYLDRITMEDINILTIKSVKDVTLEVKKEYAIQRDTIFDSYHLVAEILKHHEKKIVQDSIKIVEKSRDNDDSKRKYWRILNKEFYGLDIHPLMEYEVDELHKILYICQNPDSDKYPNFIPKLTVATVAITGIIVLSYGIVKII